MVLFAALCVKALWHFSRVEFALSILATLGVVAVGAVQAILVVVVLALLRFVQEASRPVVEILGEVPGMAGIHPLRMHDNATTIPGLMLFRFNAPYFRRQVLAAVGRAGPELNCFVLDMLPVTMIDATGYYVLRDVEAALFARGITLAVAGRQTEIELSAKQRGLDASEALARIRRFSTLRQAVHAYTLERLPPATG